MFAPATYDDNDDEFKLTIYVNSEDETLEQEEVEVSIQKATVKLELNQADIATESDLIAQKAGAVRIPIENTGLLDAPSVIVYLTPPSGAELSQTISVPAGETRMAVFENLTFPQGPQRFDYRIDVVGAEGESVESIPDPDDFSLEYNVESTADGESPWMNLLIAFIAIMVVYGGVRTSRSRSSNKF